MLVGNQDEVSVGEGLVITFPADGIDVDDPLSEGEHESAMADEGDSEVSRRSADDIFLDLAEERLSCGWGQEKEKQKQIASLVISVSTQKQELSLVVKNLI